MKIAGLIGTFALAVGLAVPAAAQDDLTEFSVALSWLRNGQYAPLLAADALGYFKEEGLKLKLLDGGPGKNTISFVGVGQADFGIDSSVFAFRSRLAETPVDISVVGAILQDGPYGYITLTDKGAPAPTPQDMVGKNIGIQADGEVFLKTLARLNNIDYDSFNIQVVQGGIEPLMTGQVDFYSGWVTNQPYQFELEAAKPDAPANLKDKTWQAIVLSKAAVPAYGDVIFTRTELLKENPELVRKVMKALARGMETTLKEPDRVAQLVTDYPDQSDDLARVKWRLANGQNELMTSDQTREHGLLWMDLDRWVKHQQVYLDAGLISRIEDPKNFVTNEFNAGIKSPQ
jgi:ABC-type nitrate/sulfonate/bicarbonate transport system substrate-binding protein